MLLGHCSTRGSPLLFLLSGGGALGAAGGGQSGNATPLTKISTTPPQEKGTTISRALLCQLLKLVQGPRQQSRY